MKRNGEIKATTNIHTYIIHIYICTHTNTMGVKKRKRYKMKK